MIDDDKGRRIAVFVFGVALIVLGIWAIIEPGLLENYDPSGRKSLIKGFVKSIWGTAGGVVAIIFGALSIIGIFVTNEDVQPQ